MLSVWQRHCIIVSWVSQSNFLFTQLLSILCLHKHLWSRMYQLHRTSFTVSVILVVLRTFLMGAIIVISASDKSLPRWVIYASDREREQSLT